MTLRNWWGRRSVHPAFCELCDEHVRLLVLVDTDRTDDSHKRTAGYKLACDCTQAFRLRPDKLPTQWSADFDEEVDV